MKDATLETMLDWTDMAFKSKSLINQLDAVLILAPREMSEKRLVQLIKEYLPKGNVILGLAKEDYILGFEDQPQFKTLRPQDISGILSKLKKSNLANKLYTLSYFQREVNYVLEKLDYKLVLLINGSWQYAFHNSDLFYTLAKKKVTFKYLSPFLDEAEAIEYESRVFKEMDSKIAKLLPAKRSTRTYNDTEMLNFAESVSKLSFDYNHQTGAVLGKTSSSKSRQYKYLASSFNKVVPFQTYALHNGASRELNYSPPHDLNHYDTVHAEVEMIISAQKAKVNLAGTTLFINLLPCPACSRMICDTGIVEIVYRLDHSDGYAIKMFEQSGKRVRRHVK